MSCSRKQHTAAGVRTVYLCIQNRHSSQPTNMLTYMYVYIYKNICLIFTLLAYTNYKFRVQALPFSMETTIVIPMTLSIYSSVTNMIWNLHLIYKGLHNLTTLIRKRHILMRTAVLYIYIYMFVECVVLVINKSTVKQNNMRHST